MSIIDPASAPLPIDAADWNEADWTAGQDTARKAGAGAGLNSIADLVRGRLTGVVEDARDNLVGQVRGLKSLADLLIGTVGDALGDNGAPVTRFIGTATSSIDTIADALAEKSVDELVDDGRELVRAQPVVAVGLAIAVGFLFGRIAKVARD